MTTPSGDSLNLRSWVASANAPGCDFPLQNLPFCAFRSRSGQLHLGVGIGDCILDLFAAAQDGLLDGLPLNLRSACTAPHLNAIMAGGIPAASILRTTLFSLLAENTSSSTRKALEPLLIPMATATFTKPVVIGDYTDFYASIHHATNVGKLFRPDQPLLPNYKHLPVGYHGRASSLVISGTDITRPHGQSKPPDADTPIFAATQQLDYELEVAAFISTGNSLGRPIDIAAASRHLFGISLLNDWSARDIQSWEYQPLGPFLGKSFATSVSPWVVTMEALTPYLLPAAPRPATDPDVLPYLASHAPEAIDLQLEVFLTTSRMREASEPAARLSASNLRNLYWTFPQMIAHHTSNGCNLCPGDLLASGTASGPTSGSEGCLLEITRRGTTPIHLPNGETRTFLEDGDEVILRGFCEREGLPRIGLGECRGIIIAART